MLALLNFGSVGWGEGLLIGVLLLLVLGPAKLPGFARTVGRSLNQFKNALRDAKKEIEK